MSLWCFSSRFRDLCAFAAVSIVFVSMSGCGHQRTRDESSMLLREGRYEQALGLLETAVKSSPDSAILRAGLLQGRAEVLTRLITEAGAARGRGQFDDAESILKRAAGIDPDNKRVQAALTDIVIERRLRQQAADAQALIDRRQPAQAWRLIVEALKDNPRHPELTALQRRLEVDVRQAQVRAAQAGLSETRPISLDFRDANLRTVLDVVSRNSGINFILDKDIRADTRVTVYLRSTRVEDAIDLIVSTNQLAKKVIDAQTILIYPNTQEKRSEHQEQVVRVFYLASAEAKGAAAFLRSMLKIREPFVDERSNMLAIRETPEMIELAARLIALYDAGEPEVLLELEVIELRSNRLTNLGIQFPNSFSLTPIAPAGATGLTLGNVRELNRDNIGLTVGGLLVNLRREVGDFTTLANPRIRTRNREKAKVLVGDRVPVITATTGTGGFVSDSVNYIDVGLKLEVEPTVYADDEVAIKIALEVSSIAGQIRTNSGTLVYQIGTRNATTVLRLRDGETQLLAGLISNEDRSAANRVPGLGDLPVAGRLFSSQQDEANRTELVLAITPRILRNVRRPTASESELWVGTDSSPRVRPVGGRLPGRESASGAGTADAAAGRPTPSPQYGAPAGPPTGTAAAGAGSSQPPSALSPPATQGERPQMPLGMAPPLNPAAIPPPVALAPAIASRAAAVEGTMPDQGASTATPSPAAPMSAIGPLPLQMSAEQVPEGQVFAAPVGSEGPAPMSPSASAVARVDLQWRSPAEVKVGEEFTAYLEISTATPLRGAPLQIRFDKAKVEVGELTEGEFFRQGGASTSFSKSIDVAEDVVRIGILRNQATSAVGQGTLLAVRLKALAPGPVDVALVDIKPVSLGGQAPVANMPTVLRVIAR